MTTTADVLRKAAEIIETRGWIQGEARGENGGYCLIAAVDVAIGEVGRTDGSVFGAVYNGMRARGLLDMGMVGFNDAPGRNVEEVTALLRFAADHEETTR